MSTMMAAGSNPESASLIVGMAIATYVAVLATIGFFARRFLTQQASNHKDTLRALTLLEHLDGRMPRNAKRRMRALEDVSHRHPGKGARSVPNPP